jgi:hypothetical protein
MLVGMGERELVRIRRIALALPDVSERVSHGAPCFFVRERRPPCYYHGREFRHSGGRISIWCPVPRGVQEELVESDPPRFFKPAPSARGTFSNWLGIYLDIAGNPVDWDEIAAIVEDAYRLVAPRSLIAEFDAR